MINKRNINGNIYWLLMSFQADLVKWVLLATVPGETRPMNPDTASLDRCMYRVFIWIKLLVEMKCWRPAFCWYFWWRKSDRLVRSSSDRRKQLDGWLILRKVVVVMGITELHLAMIYIDTTPTSFQRVSGSLPYRALIAEQRVYCHFGSMTKCVFSELAISNKWMRLSERTDFAMISKVVNWVLKIVYSVSD